MMTKMIKRSTAVTATMIQDGFPRSRSTGIARRLQEAGLLPSGAPGVPPELDENNVLDLAVALAADTELHTAAQRFAPSTR
jgi:hypothetical protein